jgi:hypothetical protein
VFDVAKLQKRKRYTWIRTKVTPHTGKLRKHRALPARSTTFSLLYRLCDPLSLLLNGYGELFRRAQSGRSAMLIKQLYKLPTIRIAGATPPLPIPLYGVHKYNCNFTFIRKCQINKSVIGLLSEILSLPEITDFSDFPLAAILLSTTVDVKFIKNSSVC